MPIHHRLCSLLLAILVAGCSSHSAAPSSATNQDSTGPHTATVSTTPTPSLSANDNVWGQYLADRAKQAAKDVQGHPYIYLIPNGDTPQVLAQRAQLLQSLPLSIGPLIIPGSLLVLGGRDPKQTDDFASRLATSIKPHDLRDTVVLIVSDARQQGALSKAYAASGATVRVVSL